MESFVFQLSLIFTTTDQTRIVSTLLQTLPYQAINLLYHFSFTLLMNKTPRYLDSST